MWLGCAHFWFATTFKKEEENSEDCGCGMKFGSSRPAPLNFVLGIFCFFEGFHVSLDALLIFYLYYEIRWQ